MARNKGHGRLFIRNGVWYMRWRFNAKECTRSTGIPNDRPSSKAKAAAMLEETTEILRLHSKEARLIAVKSMIQTTEEEIQDKIRSIRRDRTLGELAELFAKSALCIDCSAAQKEAYKRYIAVLAGVIGGDTRIVDIDARLAEVFARGLACGRSPNTYNKYLNGLSFVWKAISPSVGIAKNPWKDLRRRKLDTNVRRILTTEEIDRVFANAQGEMKSLFAIGLYTGLRMGDAVELRWESIRDGTVFVKTRKTGAQVAIPLHPRLAEAIGEPDADGGLICPRLLSIYSNDGRSLVAQRFRRLFAKCGIETSVRIGSGNARPLCGFHSLRHTFVSRCVEAGIDRFIVQSLVGHNSARMTAHYTHLSDSAFLSAFTSMK